MTPMTPVEKYITLLVCLLNTIISVLTLKEYAKTRKHLPFVNMLTGHIAMTLIFSVVCFICVLLEFLDAYQFINMNYTDNFTNYIIQYLPLSSLYVSGALLAVDRTVIMLMPMNYGAYNISRKLVIFSFSMFLLNSTIIAMALFVTPINVFRLLNCLLNIYNCLFLCELLFYLVFMILSYKYSKRNKGNKAIKHQVVQTNHITLFHMISLITLGCFSKVLLYLDLYALKDEPIGLFLHFWQMDLFILDRSTFSIHVLLVAIYTLLKLKRRTNTIMVKSTLSSRNT
ncbi:hypothetical protein L596_008754 [Steinernema carpocapsae]|uniref:G-protein coupled receptors family 1 profile domain-containing protein n=1 Tax=Steinernema carpocapsae TaxID=34508 RepID=A0A4U5PDK2_STECR|nr:hypothetical protein L596_008754 [Steinernema carpocapsae]